jgi:butyryl-CoA dehydrogenase
MGFIEETGAAQHYRDARIITIYEGTTGIQANDLIGRKTARDAGAIARNVMAQAARDAQACIASSELSLRTIGGALSIAVARVSAALDWLLATYPADARSAHASAVPYLELWGLAIGGWQMARAAQAAARRLQAGEGDRAFLEAKVATARYYAEALLPQVASLAAVVTQAGGAALALNTAQFERG